MSSEGEYDYLSDWSDQLTATASLGPPIFGFVASFWLFGIFLANFHSYRLSKQYARSSRAERVFVWIVVVLLALGTGLNIYIVASHSVTQDRTYRSVYMVEVTDSLSQIFAGAVATLVQAYLALRASRLFRKSAARRYAFLGIVGTMIFASEAISTLSCVTTLSFTYNFEDAILPLTYSLVGAIWNSLSAATDLVISLTLYLLLRKSVLGFNKRTDSAIQRLMSLSLRTAVPTTFLQVVGAILALSFKPDATYSVVWLAFTEPLAALYAISLLATLSSRRPIKNRTKAVVGSTSWLAGSHSSSTVAAAEEMKERRPSLAKRTISKMSIPQILPVVGRRPSLAPSAPSGITFTRDVVEEIVAGDELAPRFDASRPYLESYIDGRDEPVRIEGGLR